MASKKLNLRPLGDRLIVEPQEKEGKTTSGIILPETAKEKPQEGTVLAAGPGRLDDDGKRIAMDVKVGQRGVVCQVFRHRSEDRRQEVAHPQRERHPGDCGKVIFYPVIASASQGEAIPHNL